ncbi:hypothetical protein X474_25670 [Dethiosulfatarculus sandiegensis]|uniref:Uncharacterized protein n=1 Tax=Dethiosulfatarculus sandiegensis TaxID=1429043 RepID=A0A0D2JP15_9BACT|nr:hypothetical protein X474_25670 [Dethiosulfatarculus sandiegensis]
MFYILDCFQFVDTSAQIIPLLSTCKITQYFLLKIKGKTKINVLPFTIFILSGKMIFY